MELDRLVVSFFVDEVVGGFFISVPPGHVACLYDRGRGVLPQVWGPGLHLKIPFWQIAKLFNAQVLEYSISEGFNLDNREALGDLPIKTSTSDGKYIQMEGSVLFRINKSMAPQLWENVGDKFVSKVVRPIARSRIASLLSEFSLSQINTTRAKVEDLLKQELNTRFNSMGLMCEGVLLSEIKLLK